MFHKLFRKSILIPLVVLLLAVIPLAAYANGSYVPPGGSVAGSKTKVLGEQSDNFAGHSMAIVGDVNGDGFDDLVVGAPGFDSSGQDNGAAYLLLGQSVWGQVWTLGGSYVLCGWDNVVYLGNGGGFCANMFRFEGASAYSEAGYSVAGAGDVNDDGFDDFLIGAPGALENRGAAYLILGSSQPTGGILGQVGPNYISIQMGEQAGFSVAGAGDVNGDGFDDFLVGAPFASNGGHNTNGAAYLMKGGSGSLGGALNGSGNLATFTGLDSYDLTGTSVAGVGDTNGDGYMDVLIGSPGSDSNGTDAGAAHLVLGDPSINSNLASAVQYSGQFADDYAGWSVSAAGDVNRDGFDDFLIGAPYYNNAAGAVYEVDGRATPSDRILSIATARVYWGEHQNDQAGFAVAPAGDIDLDGYADFFIGAPYNSTYPYTDNGAAYMVLDSHLGGGGNLSAPSIVKYTGTGNQTQAGFSMAGNGDLNGDNAVDWVIGEPTNSANGSLAGAAHVYTNGYLAWYYCYYLNYCTVEW